MAQPANTFSRYTQIGSRESLQDIINDVSRAETPFYSMVKKSEMDVRNTFHEWQTDVLAGSNKDNAIIEGDTFSAQVTSPTTRVGNYTQIFEKPFILSRTAMRMSTAGRKNELNYQVIKKGKEIKRDFEAAALSQNAAVAGNNTTARKMAGMETWTATNANHGAGGSTTVIAAGAPTTAPVDGTARAFTETILKAVLAVAWPNGADTKTLFLGPAQKQVFSTFPGIAQTRFDLRGEDQSTIIGAADKYVGDFGSFYTIPSIQIRNRTALGIDPDMVEVKHLDPMDKEQMAKISDGEQWRLVWETTLCCKSERAHFKVADLL